MIKSCIVFTCATTMLVGCSSVHPEASSPGAIVLLDLSSLDQEGLRGPPHGKVALAYEFCIPNTERHRAEVRKLDPTVEFMPSSPGRIGCDDTQCLCIGSTHQPDYGLVLSLLAELPYINEIRRCDFE